MTDIEDCACPYCADDEEEAMTDEQKLRERFEKWLAQNGYAFSTAGSYMTVLWSAFRAGVGTATCFGAHCACRHYVEYPSNQLREEGDAK